MNDLFFCVARENLPLRHAVIFSMPCAWRGVKIFLNLSMIFQGTAKGYCSAHFLQLQMQMQILVNVLGGAERLYNIINYINNII